jgi:uncharacterized membrane protein YozB (DUF420 family)
MKMLTPETVILTLKVAVCGATLLLVASLTALARGNYRLHGRINLVFFILVLAVLLGFESAAHLVSPGMLQEFLRKQDALDALYIHLGFSVPSALLLPAMLYTGLKGRRRTHIGLGLAFLVLWCGTLVTGVFFLPHTARL